MPKNLAPKSSKIRQNLAIGLTALVLWGVVAYFWYLAYLWVLSFPALTFPLTFLALPIPALVHRATVALTTKWPGLKKPLRFAQTLAVILLALGAPAMLLPRLITTLYARSRLFSVETVPPQRVAIVFGAGLWPDGSPTPTLKDRIATAADLYLAGKVEKLLMSGDNRFVDYNEPGAMHEYALSLGVPDEAIVLDYAGRRTYDTCYRARDIFGVREAILVTTDFHLPRALYTCNMLGVPAVGVPAGWRFSGHGLIWLYVNLRELPATLGALWDVHVAHPLPILGQPEPIFSSMPQVTRS